jgi:Family of unknown function (DUF6522)
MKPVEFCDGAVEIDGAVIAEGLGITLPLLREQMQAGKITSLAERGIDADRGRHRLTFFSEHRRFRLVVDDSGTIIQRSALDFGKSPLPNSVRRARAHTR